MKRALVTGGCGFIGSHLVRRLVAEGVDVVVLDDLSGGNRDAIEAPNGELIARMIAGDVADPQAAHEAAEDCDTVFHLAAFVSAPASIRFPRICMDTNVLGTTEMIEAAREEGVPAFVFASSAAVYGDSSIPMGSGSREIDPARPTSPYGISKLAGEQLVDVLCGPTMRGVSLRFFNVYGPRQRVDSGYAAVVPAFLRAALAGEPLMIDGDGDQARDFVHVEDVVDALLLAARSPEMRGAYNVGSGESVSVGRLAEIVLRVTGARSGLLCREPRPGDTRDSRADISRITVAGWRPKHSLADGLRATVATLRQC